MIRGLVRILLAVVGVLGLAMAARFWVQPQVAAASLGVMGFNPVGVATIRADMGGFFAIAGVFALAGAWLGRSRFLFAPLGLLALALIGRLITVAHDGFVQPMVPPMAVEAVLVVIFALGAWTLRDQA
jgi:hypothetical protein